MREKLPAPNGLAGTGASAALHGWSVVPPRPAPRAVCGHADSAGRLADGAWVVALSPTKESFVILTQWVADRAGAVVLVGAGIGLDVKDWAVRQKDRRGSW